MAGRTSVARSPPMPLSRMGRRGMLAHQPDVFANPDLRRSQFTLTALERGGVPSEAAVLVGVLLPGRSCDGAPLEELEGLAAAAGTRVVGQLVQRREAPDAATYLGKGKVEELTSLAARHRRRRGHLRQRPEPRADPQPGEDRRREGPRPHRVDPGHLRRAGRDARGPPGRRAGPVGIRHAAAEADVDPPVAAEEGRGPARTGRKATGRRPPPGRAADQRPAAANRERSSAAASARWRRGGAR